MKKNKGCSVVSFVSAVITSKFITLVTDGKETNTEGKTLSENKEKYVKISDKQFIAFTGRSFIEEDVVRLYPFRDEEYDLHKVSEEFKLILDRDTSVEGIDIQIFVGGINNKKTKLFIFNNNPSLKSTFVEPVNYAFMGDCNEEFVHKLFRMNKINTVKQALSTQKMINKVVSKTNSERVNNIISESLFIL